MALIVGNSGAMIQTLRRQRYAAHSLQRLAIAMTGFFVCAVF